VHQRHRAHPVAEVLENATERRVGQRVGLQAHEAGDNLHVVLHPVMHFLQQHFLLAKRGPDPLLRLDAVHGNGHEVGHGRHHGQLVVAEARARARAERERADHPLLDGQRVAGVGLHAKGLHQLGARVGRALHVLGHDTAAVAGRAAAHRHAEIEPLDVAGLGLGNAGAGVEPQPAGPLLHQEVEEDLAIEEVHHLAAQLLDDALRLAAREEADGGFGEDLRPAPALGQRFLRLPQRRDVHDCHGAADDLAMGVADRRRAVGDEGPRAVEALDLEQLADDRLAALHGAGRGPIVRPHRLAAVAPPRLIDGVIADAVRGRARAAPHLLVRGVALNVSAPGIHHGHPYGQGLHEGFQAVLVAEGLGAGGLQGLLGPLALGNVLHGPEPAQQRGLGVELQLGALADPLHFGPHDNPVLDVVGLPPKRSLPGAVHEIPVPRVDGGQERLIRQRRSHGDAKDPVRLVGPAQLVATNVQSPAPRVGDGLGTAQITLAPAQGLRGARPGNGHCQLARQALPEGNGLEGKHPLAPVGEVQQAQQFSAHAQRSQGHRFEPLVPAVAQGARFLAPPLGSGAKLRRAVRPKTALRGEAWSRRIVSSANHAAARVLQEGVPLAVAHNSARGVPRAKPACLAEELLGEAPRFVVRVIIALSQADANGLAAGALLEEARGGLDQLARARALVYQAEEFGGRIALQLGLLGLGDVDAIDVGVAFPGKGHDPDEIDPFTQGHVLLRLVPQRYGLTDQRQDRLRQKMPELAIPAGQGCRRRVAVQYAPVGRDAEHRVGILLREPRQHLGALVGLAQCPLGPRAEVRRTARFDCPLGHG